MDPGPLTLRELVWMGQGQAREGWSRTSHILAMIAEANRDRKKRRQPFHPSEFNPTVPQKKGKGLSREASRDALKAAFLSGGLGWRGAKK